MATAVAKKPAFWLLSLLWLSPLLFLVWWFYITLPEQADSVQIPPWQQMAATEAPLLAADKQQQLWLLAEQHQGSNLILQHGQRQQPLYQTPAQIQLVALSPSAEQWAWSEQQEQQQRLWIQTAGQPPRQLNSPCPASLNKLQFLSDDELLLLCNHQQLFRLQAKTEATLVPQFSGDIVDFDVKQQQLFVLSSNQLQSYSWPTLTPMQHWPLAQSFHAVTVVSGQPLLAMADTLYQLDPATAELMPLQQSQGNIQHLLSDGQDVYALDHQQPVDSWLFQPTTASWQLRFGSARAETLATQNSQGTVVYLNQGAGPDELWLRPQGQNPYRLTTLPDNITVSAFSWSHQPDFIWLLTAHHIYRLNAITGQLTLVWQSEQPLQQLAELSNGDLLILQQQQLYSLDWQQKKLQPYLSERIAAFSVDGDSVYLQRPNDPDLWQLDQQKLLRLLPQVFSPDTVHWQLKSSQLWLLKPEQLSRQSIDQGKEQQQWPVPAGITAPLTVGPDGIWLSKYAPAKSALYHFRMPVQPSH